MSHGDPHSKPSPSRWVAFPCTYEKHRALITADAGLVDSAPDASRPFCLEVAAGYDRPKPDGMPNAADLQQLLDLEARLAGALAKDFGAVAAGTVTGNARRAMYFYLPTEPQMNDRFIPEIRTGTKFALGFRIREDREWSVYRNTLYPNLLGWNFIQNHELTTRLKSMGDDLATPRRIRHYAHFPSADAKQQFTAQAASLGLTPTERSNTAPFGRFDFGICLAHDAAADMAHMIPLTEDLCGRADKLGGAYDGWECEVEGPAVDG